MAKAWCERHVSFHDAGVECPDCRAMRVDSVLREIAEEPPEEPTPVILWTAYGWVPRE